MSETSRLRLEAPAPAEDQLTLAASLDDPAGRRHRLWFRFPLERQADLTDTADPFVLGFLFPMMQWGRPVHVEGQVSPSLLDNLERLMAIWSCWRRGKYRPVSIRAELEAEPPAALDAGAAVTPCSCGVDSGFTIYRHAKGLVGRRGRRIGLALSMYGFDIRLDQLRSRELYNGLLESCREITQSVDVPLVSVATNYHDLPVEWGMALGTQLGAGLMFFQRRFDHALIANDLPYARLYSAWGSHPLTNPLMGHAGFRIDDDGGEFTRVEKLRLIGQWPQAMRNLRVCFENRESHRNCCRCEKCLRTILAFKATGLPLPPSLPREPTVRDIRRAHYHSVDVSSAQWEEIYQDARAAGLDGEPWAAAIKAAQRRNRLLHRMKRLKTPLLPLRNRIRKLVRGSELSRRQLRRQAEVGS